ncbi:hypothetical protein ACIGHB_07305 [Streptomyces sp. NPDC085460]|uniref:hypothetical protein n=1 Tax=Streptomyces sp. NPDC085460 TaxID=3365723 RepID=UPI0037D0D8C2
MISEPELVGGAPFETAEVLTEDREPRPPRGRGPSWAWALGGALVASALWGAGLYAYGLGQRDEGVDLGGYKPVEELCEKAELKGLAMVLGERAMSGPGPFLDEPALSESSCHVNFGEGEREQSASVTYTLHKETDPGVEFAAHAKYRELILPVAGVGEQAFFGDRGEDGGSLWVLDGQAVVQIEVHRNYYADENGEPLDGAPDLSGIDVPLTQDVLALLAELKK